jgi:quinol monooxygenase YgiN
MATQDTSCTIVPHFMVHEGELDTFKALCEQFVVATKQDPKCLYYGFSFNGNEAYCRESYQDAEALLNHIENVGALIDQSLALVELIRLEVHGIETELAKLRAPLAGLNPQYYVLEYGFRR